MIRPTTTGLVAGCGAVAAGLVWVAVVRPSGAAYAAAWFVVVAVVGAFLPGLANQVSLARAYLAAPALVYALSPSGLLPLAAVVTLAGASDLVDGAVARRLEKPTRLGGALDPVVDGVFFGAVAVGLALGTAYPFWLCGVVILRYLVPAVAGALLLLLGRQPALSHTPVGQVSTLLIGILLGGVALLRGLGQDSAWLVTVATVVIPVAAVATWANLAWASRAAFTTSRG